MGDINNTKDIPNRPVYHTNFFTTAMVLPIRYESPSLAATDTSRTALCDNPNEETCLINSVLELNNCNTPMPAGPSSTAIILDLITPIRI